MCIYTSSETEQSGVHKVPFIAPHIFIWPAYIAYRAHSLRIKAYDIGILLFGAVYPVIGFVGVVRVAGHHHSYCLETYHYDYTTIII